jgi:hypothetical protein
VYLHCGKPTTVFPCLYLVPLWLPPCHSIKINPKHNTSLFVCYVTSFMPFCLKIYDTCHPVLPTGWDSESCHGRYKIHWEVP